jgi:hypothetical protein
MFISFSKQFAPLCRYLFVVRLTAIELIDLAHPQAQKNPLAKAGG